MDSIFVPNASDSSKRTSTPHAPMENISFAIFLDMPEEIQLSITLLTSFSFTFLFFETSNTSSTNIIQEIIPDDPRSCSDEKKVLSMMLRMALSKEDFLDHSDNILQNSILVHVTALSS